MMQTSLNMNINEPVKYGKFIYKNGKQEDINKENLLFCLTKIIKNKPIKTIYNIYDYDDNLRCVKCDEYSDTSLKTKIDFKSEEEYKHYVQEREKNKHHIEKDNNVLSIVRQKANSFSSYFKYNFFVLSLADEPWLKRIKNNNFSESISLYHGAKQYWHRGVNKLLYPDNCKPNTKHLKDATEKLFKQVIDENHDFVLMTGDSISADVGLVASCLLEGISSLATFNISHITTPEKLYGTRDIKDLNICYFDKLENANLFYIPPIALTQSMSEVKELQSLVLECIAEIIEQKNSINEVSNSLAA